MARLASRSGRDALRVRRLPPDDEVPEKYPKKVRSLSNSSSFFFVIVSPILCQPPSEMLCTPLMHPNVFGKWICLDMLELGGWAAVSEQDRIFTGWSSA